MTGISQGHSTETVVLKVISDIIDAADSQKITLLGLLDTSAALTLSTTRSSCVAWKSRSVSVAKHYRVAQLVPNWQDSGRCVCWQHLNFSDVGVWRPIGICTGSFVVRPLYCGCIEDCGESLCLHSRLCRWFADIRRCAATDGNQTWNRVTGSPGQLVIWVIFSVWVTGSPGHICDPVGDPNIFNFSNFRTNAQNAQLTF